MYSRGMPTRQLKFRTGERYHVVNRGARKIKIFRDERDYQKLLELAERYKGKGVEMVAHGLAFNHYHVLVRQVLDGGVVRFFSSVQRVYARYFNKKYKASGALFGGRFWAEEIQDEKHFYNVVNYILRNPAKHKMSNLGMDGLSGGSAGGTSGVLDFLRN